MEIKPPTDINELICITQVWIDTEEGKYPGFIAFDQCSHFCFMAEFVEELNTQTMLEAMDKLIANEMFEGGKDFLILTDFGEELSEEFNIITGMKSGRMAYAPEYVKEATAKDLNDLFKSMG